MLLRRFKASRADRAEVQYIHWEIRETEERSNCTAARYKIFSFMGAKILSLMGDKMVKV